MRRFIGIVLLVVTLVTVSGLWAKGPVEISYYLWDDPTYKNIIDTYNASQSEIFVKATYLPAGDYETKIITMLAGGAKLDCYMQKRQVDMFPNYKNGFIEPLDNYIKKYKYDINSIKAYLPQVTIDGKIMAIPFRGAGYYTYYNKKIFADAGAPTPDVYVEKGEWTWDKFAEVARKLATGDGRVYGAVMYIWPICSYQPSQQHGDSFIDAKGNLDFDPEVLKYSLELRRQLEKEKAIIPLMELKATKTHYSKAFYDGNVGMLLIGEWFPGMMIKGRDEKLLQGYTWNDWGLTRLPCNEPEYITVGTATFNHVYSRSKNKDAAFKFLAWMGGPEGAEVVAKNGFMPPLDTPGVRKQLATSLPDEKSLEYMLEPARRALGAYNKYGSQIEAVFNRLIEEYLVTEMTGDQLIKEIESEFKEIIKNTD